MEAIVLITLLLVYFVPTVMAWGKRCQNSVLMLNLFLGWTIIGWIIALIWSLNKDAQPVKIINQPSPQKQTSVDQLTRLAELRDKGVLSQEEFEGQKNKILNS
ncbi:superinfection immunity protein [Paradesertivirga mongoliensis]|uniref:Superinfection immunity protein n=1 Tax=Paradesertivirga mongoliensis TaxID=2100740 RepID=A0ABW4ZNL9_9SPHI|nr:superinfection immunity protein [Pedobacter mongoliensis]